MSRSLDDHLFAPGKKRVLAIDGGGARGILACGILKRIETLLKSRLPLEQREGFRLHHYFDLIGGTSTGSILAAGLAIGLSVDDLKKLYLRLCPKVFVQKAKGARVPRFDAKRLEAELGRVLREEDGKALPLDLDQKVAPGQPILLGSPALRTGFAVFAKRINTGGAWTLTNNPKWRYYDDVSHAEYCKRMNISDTPGMANKDFALAQLVQASAAAPTFFASVGIRADRIDDGSQGVNIGKVGDVKPPDGVLVDGAVSGRNTPALQMLYMVRHPAFGFEWQTTHRNAAGDIEEDLLMISVGTGWWRPKVTEAIRALHPLAGLAPEAAQAILILQTMIHDSQLTALQWLQSMSRYPVDVKKRWAIDGEVNSLLVEGGSPFLISGEPLLRFRRLDLRLEDGALEELLKQDVEKEARALGLVPKSSGELRSFLQNASAAWGQSPLTMRLRELAENDRDALLLLYELGSRYADNAIDDDDFPSTFDPDYRGGAVAGDTTSVVDAPDATSNKSGFFWRRSQR